MIRPLEYRVRMLRSDPLGGHEWRGEWAPATVARVAEAVTDLAAGVNGPGAVLEIRPRRDVERERRRRKGAP